MPVNPEQVEVVQADRDAAADWFVMTNRLGITGTGGEFISSLRSGRYDEHPLVQAFARHRIAHSPTLSGDDVGQDVGASASPKPALVASDQAASRLDPTGFDPTRGAFPPIVPQSTEFSLAENGYARLERETIVAWMRELFLDGLEQRQVALEIADRIERGCHHPTCDSDRNPEGEKPQALSAKHESAGPKDIAQ